MKKKNASIVAVMGSLLLMCNSCGISQQMASNVNAQETEVVLAKKNYKVIGNVTGESTQKYVFGIGGLSRKSLNQSALADMYNNADLNGKSRAVVNASVVAKTKFILSPIYTETKVIATGTLIEFTE